MKHIIETGDMCLACQHAHTLEDGMDCHHQCSFIWTIFLSSGTKEEHSKHLCRLQKAGLTINLPKSEFFASKLEFLGRVVDASKIKPSPKHMAAVLKRNLRLLNFF